MNTTTVSLLQPNLNSQNVKRVVERLFSGYTGSLGVRLCGGQVISLGEDSPVATVVIHAAAMFRSIGASRAKDRVTSVRCSLSAPARMSRWHSKALNRHAITFRYGVSNELYRLCAHAIYDKVASIGMFEHVGRKNLPNYFRAVGRVALDRVLKPGGLFLNHAITDSETGKPKTVGTEFIQRYVFPDSELERVSNVQREMELNGFEISDVEALRPHYAMTLRHWVHRLDARRVNALTHVSEARYQIK